MGVLGVLGLAPQVESMSLGFRWEHDLPVRVPGLSLWHRSQAVRLHCQFVTPQSNPARNGRGTSGGRDAGVVSGRDTVASTLAPGSRHPVPSGGLTAKWGTATTRTFGSVVGAPQEAWLL